MFHVIFMYAVSLRSGLHPNEGRVYHKNNKQVENTKSWMVCWKVVSNLTYAHLVLLGVLFISGAVNYTDLEPTPHHLCCQPGTGHPSPAPWTAACASTVSGDAETFRWSSSSVMAQRTSGTRLKSLALSGPRRLLKDSKRSGSDTTAEGPSTKRFATRCQMMAEKGASVNQRQLTT